MPARFELNRAGIREYLLSGELYPALEDKARPIYERAKSLASQHIDSGEYERGIQPPSRERSSDRVVVRVHATDEKSAVIEARYHVMGKAVTG